MSNATEPPSFPPFRTFLWAGILLSLLGWGGLAILIATTLPTLGPRWLFFFLLLSALSGTTLPVAYFVNLRFPTNPPADGGAIIREAVMVGVYVCLLAWLQQGRVLTAPLAVILGLGFFIIEFLLRVREISRWKPREPVDE
uniref:Uncharacterized protein n=1 Tax=Anaerolinea thermolimosa TaxID=229919 RepID=A0A7C4KH88_9CHLR